MWTARDWGPLAIPSQKFAKFRKPSTSSVPADLIPPPQCLISLEFNVLPMWVLWRVLPRFQPRKLKAVVTNLFPYVAQQLCIFNSNWVNLFIQHSTNICPELLCTWGTYLKGKGRVGRVGKCLGYGIARETFPPWGFTGISKLDREVCFSSNLKVVIFVIPS